MAMPDVTVEIAWPDGNNTPAASRTWTDMTSRLEAQNGISITRGRGDEQSTPQPSKLTVTFDNTDGALTPENIASAYYPNVRKGRPIRVRVAIPGNLLTGNDASFEGTLGNWAANGTNPPTIVNNATHVHDGINAARITWAGTGGTADMRINLGTAIGLTIGVTYTVSVWVWVAGGGPDVRLRLNTPATTTAYETTKGSDRRLTMTFTATVTNPVLILEPSSTAVAGQLWVDSAMVQTGDTVTDFTTAAPSTVDLFTGYIQEIPVEWPGGSDAMSTVTITASSRQERMGRSAEFKSIVEEEVLYDVPTGYWPLGEPEGATEAGNIATGRSERLVVTQRGTGGTVTFGTGTGPGTDDLTTPTFAPATESQGKHLLATLNAPVAQTGDHAVALSAWFTTSTTPAFEGIIATLSVSDLYDIAGAGSVVRPTQLVLNVNIFGEIECRLWDSLSQTAASYTLGPSVVDGALHHATALATINDAGTKTVTLIIDGVVDGTSSANTWSYVQSGAAFFPTFSYLSVGGVRRSLGSSLGDGMFTGTIGHVAIHRGATLSTARFTEHYEAGATGFEGETAGARIERYARYAGIPTAEIAAEAGLTTGIAHVDITGTSPIEAMQAIATTEDGLVFDAADGTLTFHGRDHRYDATSTFTLDTEAGDIEEGFLPRLDDQGQINDITVSRPAGAGGRADNQASIDEHGYYREDLTILTTSDDEAQDRADWEVNRFGEPRVTVPNLRTDLMTSGVQSALLASEIGDKFTVTNLPAQAPSTTMEFFIEGITHNLTDESWFVEFNTSAAAYSNVWQLGVAGFSELGETTVLAY